MRTIAFLATGILGGAIPVLAQTTASPTFQERLTITATATEEAAAGVPATVEVLGREEIEDRKSLFALELLRTVAGLDTARAGGVGKLASVFVRGTNSSHVQVLRDGMVLNDPYLGGFDWSTLGLEGVERVEVARGPYSALYGSPALGGVIQLVTRSGPSPWGGFRLEAGEDGHQALGGGGSWPQGRVRLRPSVQLFRTDGTLRNDFHDADEAGLGVDLTLAKGWEIRPSLAWLQSETGLPIGFGGRPTPRRTQEFERRSVGLPLAGKLGDLELELLVAGMRTALAVTDRDDPFGASASRGRREQARLLIRGAAGPHLEWVAGSDVQRDRVESESAFGPGLRGERQRTIGPFLQGSFRSGRFRADVGARYDRATSFGGETSLRFGGVFQVTEGSRLRFGYGEAFRAPSLADLYFPGFSNPGLRPEEVRSGELAWEWSRSGVSLGLIGYYQDLNDLIEFDFLTFRPVNLGEARARGLELLGGYRGGPIEVRVAATWQDAEDRRTGRALLRRADFKGNAMIFLRLESWTMGATLRHVGERLDFGNVPLEEHTVLDLVASFRFRERFEPYLRVLNATDRDYQEIAGFPAPGRAIQAGCSIRL